jgi:hypothetical protein
MATASSSPAQIRNSHRNHAKPQTPTNDRYLNYVCSNAQAAHVPQEGLTIDQQLLAAARRAQDDAFTAQFAEVASSDVWPRIVRHGYGPERSIQPGPARALYATLAFLIK